MSDALRTSYFEQLATMRSDIVRMIAAVTEMVPRATDAFLNNDLAAAQYIIDEDDLLDALSLRLDNQCTALLALQQPLATDLREIVACIRLNPEIGRSGDLCVNIAKATRRMFGTQYPPHIRGLLVQMSDVAQRMYQLAGEAYAERDVAIGQALDDIDDRLDDLANELVARVLADHKEKEVDPQVSVQLALLGRFYERIGDHAVTVGEWVRFVVEGWTPTHIGAQRATMVAQNRLKPVANPEEQE